jgi:hypothetical protein
MPGAKRGKARGQRGGRGRGVGSSPSKLQTKTLTNERFVASPQEVRGMEAWRRKFGERIATPARELFKVPNANLRALDDKVRAAVTKVAGISIQGTALDPERYTIADITRGVDWIKDRHDIPDFPFNPQPPPPPNGEFWWASTDYWWPGGIEAQWETDGLHFFGGISYDGDPLIFRSAGAVAHFVLAPSRRPPSPNGRWRSLTGVELFGTIVGFSGLHHWLWAADDKWCKCWVDIKQTAYQMVGLNRVVLAVSAPDYRNLINEENNGRSVMAILPGFVPLMVEFGLVDPGATVWVDIEVRFDIQLEGWSFIAFSPNPNPMNSVLLRTPQWKAHPI